MPSLVPEHDPRIVWRSAADIRARFLEYFAERGHATVPSSSLVPAGDNTLLFVNSGMVPFKDALTGAEKRSYTRAVNFQRCLRVAGKHNDFEEVGRSPRHHTLFEMLGNWSFGDYFKREAIHWAWDFLTKDLGIPGERLAATVYSTDDFAHAVWKDEIGLPPERLVRWGDFPNGDEKNWWRMADTGPCGPCSRAPLRPRAAVQRGRRLRPGPLRAVPALAGGLEPRVHGVRAPPGSVADAARRAGHRHRHGPRADHQRRPAGRLELRHGPVRRDPRADARAVRPRPGRVRGGALQLPGHRRPLPRDHVPDRRRRAAVERGPRLRLPPDRPARGAPRPPARAQGAVPRRGGEGRDRHDGRRVPVPARAGGLDPRRHHPRGDAVRAHARGGHGPARGGAHPADLERSRDRAQGRRPAGRRAGPARHGRVQAPRHVRLPDRPHDRARGRVRRRGRPRRVRRGARRAARAQPLRQEGGPRAPGDRGRAVRGDPRPLGRHDVPRLRDDDGRGEGRRDPARRDRVRGSRGQGRRGAAHRGGRRRRGHPRPHAVLSRGRRPDRGSRRAAARGRGRWRRREPSCSRWPTRSAWRARRPPG